MSPHVRMRLLQLPAAFLLGAALTVPSDDASAQMVVPTFNGDYGLLSGTMAPPGAYAVLFGTWYRSTKIKDGDGNTLTTGLINIYSAAFAFSYVAERKFMSANYSAMLAVPFTSTSLELPRLGTNVSFSISDVYFQPLRLGWHFPSGDAVAGYATVLPTGRYIPNGTQNTGFGMLTNEFSLGGTVYFDKDKVWNLAAYSTLLISSAKQGTGRRPGNVMTIEGGLGRKFKKGMGNAGIVTYDLFKVTHDQNIILPPRLNKPNVSVALGPEITYPILGLPHVLSVTARMYFEVLNHSSTQGSQLILMLNYGKPTIPPTESAFKDGP